LRATAHRRQAKGESVPKDQYEEVRDEKNVFGKVNVGCSIPGSAVGRIHCCNAENRVGITFAPGDKMLFKAGGMWTGQLAPKGSGASGSPITIGSYGTGNKLILDGGGAVSSVIYLNNQQYRDIIGLEITNNSATEAVRRGIYIYADNAGTLNHFYLNNLYIHNVKADNSFTGTGKILSNVPAAK
jgi:hypothetical protein